MLNSSVKFWQIFAVWTFLALFFASQLIIENSYSQRPVVWWRTLCLTLIFFYLWLALIPVILNLDKRFPIKGVVIIKSLLIHIPASLALSLAHLAIYAAIYPFLMQSSAAGSSGGQPISFGTEFPNLLVNFFHLGLVFYWSVLFIKFAAESYRKDQARALRESQLEASLTQAQLQVLKMQLQPHFLFNTLNTITEMIHDDPNAAESMTVRLSNLLRASLDSAGVTRVALKEELEFLQKYLSIEQIRFGPRLSICFDIEPETLDTQVPNMILQPLVENSIRYAVSPRKTGGRVEIAAKIKQDFLWLQVADDGNIISEKGIVYFAEGVGLSNTRNRLRHLYGGDFRFDLRAAENGGLIVIIEIPLKGE